MLVMVGLRNMQQLRLACTGYENASKDDCLLLANDDLENLERY